MEEKKETKKIEKLKEKLKTSREKLRESKNEFNKELKKAINVAIVAAFGFLMALAWRDVITEYVNEIVAVSPAQGKLISALIITIISVVGILVVTKFLRTEE